MQKAFWAPSYLLCRCLIPWRRAMTAGKFSGGHPVPGLVELPFPEFQLN